MKRGAPSERTSRTSVYRHASSPSFRYGSSSWAASRESAVADDSIQSPSAPRAALVALTLLTLFALGLTLGAPRALAEGGSPPETPITGPGSGECPSAPVAERVEICGTLNPHTTGRTSFRWDYSNGPSCRGGVETNTWETVEGEAVKESLELPYLLPGTYTYCLVAWNEYGEAVGQPVAFTTAGECTVLWVHSGEEALAVPGSSSLGAPLGSPSTEQTMLGTIHLECGGVVYYHFEYRPTAGAWSSTATQELAIAAHQEPQVSADLSELEPGTVYRYRLVATYGPYTAAGAEAQFTTPPAEPGPGTQGDQPVGAGDFAVTASPPASPPAVVDASGAHVAAGGPRSTALAQLVRTLEACKKKPRSVRASCQRRARRKYAVAARRRPLGARAHQARQRAKPS